MQYFSGMDRARRALVEGERLPSGVLPSQIANSWLRCRDYGHSPGATPEDIIVPFEAVRQRRERNPLLRRLALAEMHNLYAQIAGSNFMIAFADPDGVVLDTVSDQLFADSAPAGRSFREACGTKEMWGPTRLACACRRGRRLRFTVANTTSGISAESVAWRRPFSTHAEKWSG